MRNWSENQIELVLIRHGATRANREHRYLGRTEERLSREGIRELLEYREQKRYPAIGCLFVSPMKRCMETAQILYPEKEAVVIPEWREMDFGAFEGKNYQELQGDVRYQAWIDSNGTLPFPEGESREAFILRGVRGFERMRELLLQRMDEGQKEDRPAGLIVHGGTIMALLSRYAGGEYFDYQVPNGSGYVCTMKNWNHEPEIVMIEKI